MGALEQTADSAGTPARQARAGNGGVIPPPEYRWKPGESGNPTGGWTDPPGPRLRRAMSKILDAHPERAESIVEAMIAAAEAGDIKAATALWDREEGKPKQAIEHSGEIIQQTRVVVRGRAVEQLAARQTHNLEAAARATNGSAE